MAFAIRLCGPPLSGRFLSPFIAQALGAVAGAGLFDLGGLAGPILTLAGLGRFGLGVGSPSFSTCAVTKG